MRDNPPNQTARNNHTPAIYAPEINVAQVGVVLLVLLNQVGHKVQGDHAGGPLGKGTGEAADPGAKLHDAQLVDRTQQVQDLWPAGRAGSGTRPA